MSKKKKLKPEEELGNNVKELVDLSRHWLDICENGCNDPGWADGTNMNLVRNHILYCRNRIKVLCDENGFAYPAEYFFPVPPEAENGYMAAASMGQAQRVERLRGFGDVLTTEKPKYANS